jgi:hypothetical protein
MVLIEEQDEAAIRLVDASPDCNEYRPISLLVNFFSGLHCTTSLALSCHETYLSFMFVHCHFVHVTFNCHDTSLMYGSSA